MKSKNIHLLYFFLIFENCNKTNINIIIYSCKELPKPISSRDCSNDCKSKICVLSDWSDWSECPQDSCIDGNDILYSANQNKFN